MLRRTAHEAGIRKQVSPTHVPALFRDPPDGERSRHPRGARDARPQFRQHHGDLHPLWTRTSCANRCRPLPPEERQGMNAPLSQFAAFPSFFLAPVALRRQTDTGPDVTAGPGWPVRFPRVMYTHGHSINGADTLMPWTCASQVRQRARQTPGVMFSCTAVGFSQGQRDRGPHVHRSTGYPVRQGESPAASISYRLDQDRPRFWMSQSPPLKTSRPQWPLAAQDLKFAARSWLALKSDPRLPRSLEQPCRKQRRAPKPPLWAGYGLAAHRLCGCASAVLQEPSQRISAAAQASAPPLFAAARHMRPRSCRPRPSHTPALRRRGPRSLGASAAACAGRTGIAAFKASACHTFMPTAEAATPFATAAMADSAPPRRHWSAWLDPLSRTAHLAVPRA